MSFFHTIGCRLLVACGAILPITLAAQTKQSPSTAAPLPTLSEQQRAGEGLFLQNCPLCHVPVKKNIKDPNEAGTPRGASLAGLFKKPVSEDVVRQLIQQGVPGKMPGFQYTLGPKEIADIIAYLKTL